MLTLAACNSGGGGSSNNPTKTPSAKAELLSLKISDGDTDHTVDITGDTGEVRDVPQGKPLTIGEITISSGATAKITTADTSSDAKKDAEVTLNSNNEFSITITAEDKKTTQTYTISVGFIPNENAKLTALHLRADGVDYTVDIDGTDGSVTLPYGATNLTIGTIEISENATSSLQEGETITLNGNQFTITVTAGNATSAYTITIETAPNDKAELQQLHVRVGSTDYTVDIRADNKTGAVHVPHNTDLASLTIGAITISDNATSSLQQGETITLNDNQFSITVTAEDTTTTETYTITVTLAPSDEAQLRALRIAGKEVEFAGITGKVTLLYGTALADITIDSIALSDDATADFSDTSEAKTGATIPALNNKQFTITVTAEDGTTTADYSITIDDTPTLAVTGHYDEQRIGAGDFTKDNLLQIGNVQNGEWSYTITVNGTAKDGAGITRPQTPQTQTAIASDSSFDTNPLTVEQWNMFRDNSNDAYRLTISVKLWKSGQTEPDTGIDFTGIAKEQYLLKSWQDVQAINHDLAGDYTLMHDITFPEAGEDGMPAAGFEPIGQLSGNLYGNNKALRNLYINRPTTDNVGLIAILRAGASIDSLSLVLHADGIRGNQAVGALVGQNFGSISHSDVSGDVSGSNYVGGLAGRADNGHISHSYATGNITGRNKVGGLAGRVDNGHISHSYASGDVSEASGDVSEVGGLIGAAVGGVTISKSYATGDVSGNLAVGGLVGSSITLRISNNYASGDVSGDERVGGLIGTGDSSSNSYWDNTVNDHITADTDSRTTEQMKMQSTFVGWDFTSDWGIDASINNGYPYLRGVGPQPANAKQLLALSLQADTTARVTIDEGNKTGAAQLPTDTDTANIRISYIWIAGARASLAKGDTVTISNNSFSITVTAEDGTTQDYAITLTLQ